MIKNIIFDFGGVLVDWNPEYLYKQVFQEEAEMNYFLTTVCTPEWNLQQDAGRSLAAATDEIVAKFPKYQKQIEMFYGNWTAMLGGEIFENVALIEPLKRKFKLFGLSNWSAETFPKAKEMFPFFQKLDGIVLSGEEKLIKPGEQIYKVLLSRYKLIASECLFIDDSIKNIMAAEMLGFHTIHFAPNINLKYELQRMKILK